MYFVESAAARSRYASDLIRALKGLQNPIRSTLIDGCPPADSSDRREALTLVIRVIRQREENQLFARRKLYIPGE